MPIFEGGATAWREHTSRKSARERSNTASEREWLLPTAERSWREDVQRAEQSWPIDFMLSPLVRRNHDEKACAASHRLSFLLRQFRRVWQRYPRFSKNNHPNDPTACETRKQTQTVPASHRQTVWSIEPSVKITCIRRLTHAAWTMRLWNWHWKADSLP